MGDGSRCFCLGDRQPPCRDPGFKSGIPGSDPLFIDSGYLVPVLGLHVSDLHGAFRLSATTRRGVATIPGPGNWGGFRGAADIARLALGGFRGEAEDQVVSFHHLPCNVQLGGVELPVAVFKFYRAVQHQRLLAVDARAD